MLNLLISLKLLLQPPVGRRVCQNYSFKNNETIESLNPKNIIFINNYSSFLTANGAPKKRFYGGFFSITKLGFSALVNNIKCRINCSSINCPSQLVLVINIKKKQRKRKKNYFETIIKMQVLQLMRSLVKKRRMPKINPSIH